STIIYPGGQNFADAQSTSLSMPALTRLEFRQQLTINNPARWSLEEPNLYRAVTMVEADGNAEDEYETAFGIRTIRFDPDKGFLLNDKPVRSRAPAIIRILPASASRCRTRFTFSGSRN